MPASREVRACGGRSGALEMDMIRRLTLAPELCSDPPSVGGAGVPGGGRALGAVSCIVLVGALPQARSAARNALRAARLRGHTPHPHASRPVVEFPPDELELVEETAE